MFFFLFFIYSVFFTLESRVQGTRRNNLLYSKRETFLNKKKLSLYNEDFSKKRDFKQKKKKLVVVYLHGTFGLREILTIASPIKSLKFLFSLRNAKKKEIWLRFEHQRWAYDKNYFSCIMNEKSGLVFVNFDQDFLFKNFSYDAACNILFLKKYFIQKQKVILDQKNISNLDFYVYNWSGSPYFLDRRKEAIEFYSQIEKLDAAYRQDNIQPVFCIIGYSHGGNLVLDPPKQFVKNTSLCIDFLVLLGTPILDLTKDNIYLKKNIQEYFFKHIVNVYSPSDKIQVIDFTSPNKGYIFGIRHNFGFSKRRLSSRKKHKKRSNIYNISCSYLFYQKKFLKNKFYFSDIQSGILHLNHYNLAYFRNFYKKTIGKRKQKNFYFPPVLLLVPHLLSLIVKNFIKEEFEADIFFQFLKNTLYLVEKEENNICQLKGRYILKGLNQLYIPLIKNGPI
jgi:hypothetical protein